MVYSSWFNAMNHEPSLAKNPSQCPHGDLLLNTNSLSGAALLIVNHFTDIFTHDKSNYTFGHGSDAYTNFGTTLDRINQTKKSKGQYLITLVDEFLYAFANKTETNGVIPTFSDLVRVIFHEAQIHIGQRLGKNDQSLSGRAEGEMEGYWRMFEKLPGLGNASPQLKKQEWSIFINKPKVIYGNPQQKRSWDLMNKEQQKKWAIPYLIMNIYVNGFKIIKL
jgi:hypothetical protein